MVAHGALALLAYIVSVPAVALRWRAVLRGVTGQRLPLGPLVLASLASSFVNNVTAGPAGEACRVVALVRLRFTTASRATAAVVYERLGEVPVFVLMAIVALVFAGRNVRLATDRAWIAIGALGGAALMLWAGRRLVARWWTRLRDWARAEAVTIAPATLAVSAGWSVAVWLLDVTRLWLVARIFHVHISVAQAAALSAITIVGGLAPTVGGLGVIEGGLIAALLAFGVPSSSAIAITAVERSISYGLATVAGAGALAVLGGRELWAAARTARGVEAASEP
jgi:uncharacterized membrane protein YbhN (UPF0104 family)